MVQGLQFRAFLSYAHADMGWAKWLHERLESFTLDKEIVGRQTPLGPVPSILRPIFRDRDDFSGGANLADATIAALDNSSAIIVLCSVTAASRPAVNEEVRLFRFRHPDRAVIPVLIDGGYPENTPPALRFEIDANGIISDRTVAILGPDLRDEADGRELGLAKLVAGLIGVATDELVHRAERRRRRRLQVWISGLSVLAAVLAALTLWAEHERRIAQRNFEIAEQTASSLVSDIAGDLHNIEGVRSEAVRKILGTAERVFDNLVNQAEGGDQLKYDQSAMYDQFALVYAAQGDVKLQFDSAQKSLDIMHLLVRRDPSNRVWQDGLTVSESKLADAKKASGDLEGALALYQSATETLQKLGSDQKDGLIVQSRLASLQTDIGDVLFAKGDFSGATAKYRAARAGHEKLSRTDGGDPGNRQRMAIAEGKLGEVFTAQGDFAQALASYGQSLQVQERLSAAYPENVLYRRGAAVDRIHIGDIHRSRDEYSQALQNYVAARNLLDHIVAVDPRNAAWQRDLSVVLERIGLVSDDMGDSDAALASYERRHTLAERLAEHDPLNVKSRLDLAVSHNLLGTILSKMNRVDDAIGHQQQAAALLENLVAANPGNTGIMLHLPSTERDLGSLELQNGDIEAALKAFRRALLTGESLRQIAPANDDWLRDKSDSYNKIGDALVAQDKWRDALENYNAGLELTRDLMAKAPQDLDRQFDLAVSLWKIASMDRDHGEFGDASSGFKEARDVMARLTSLHPDNKAWNDDLMWVDEQLATLRPCIGSASNATAAPTTSCPKAK